jgi:hypothetical protein
LLWGEPFAVVVLAHRNLSLPRLGKSRQVWQYLPLFGRYFTQAQYAKVGSAKVK